MAEKCDTTHGSYRCDHDKGHEGNCETVHGPKGSNAPNGLDEVTRLRNDRRNAIELYKLERDDAAKLRAALEEIRTTPCEKDGDASCLCCLHDRMIASAALGVGS